MKEPPELAVSYCRGWYLLEHQKSEGRIIMSFDVLVVPKVDIGRLWNNYDFVVH
jgi:hypothetical protein